MPTPSVRARRRAFSWSQTELADLVGVSRQALGAIESGSSVPGVDVAIRLARALSCSVEDLFVLDAESIMIETRHTRPHRRVALAQVDGKLVAHDLVGQDLLSPCDGITESAGQVKLLRPLSAVRQNLYVSGCSPALALLSQHYGAELERGRCIWVPCSNAAALAALNEGRTHVASIHAQPGANLTQGQPAIRSIGLAHWQMGLVSRKPRAQRIVCVAHLARPQLRIASREPGAAAQDLLESQLALLDLSVKNRCPPTLKKTGHMMVGQAVAEGQADAGIASMDVARAFDLHFVPIAEERVDLVFAERPEPQMERLFNQLTSRTFLRQLEALGYDTTCAGQSGREGEAS